VPNQTVGQRDAWGFADGKIARGPAKDRALDTLIRASPVVVRAVTAHVPGVVPQALAAAEMLVVGLLDPASEVADRLGVRDPLEQAEDCDHGDCHRQDDYEASPSASEASSASHCVSFEPHRTIGKRYAGNSARCLRGRRHPCGGSDGEPSLRSWRSET